MRQSQSDNPAMRLHICEIAMQDVMRLGVKETDAAGRIWMDGGRAWRAWKYGDLLPSKESAMLAGLVLVMGLSDYSKKMNEGLI